MAAPDGPADGQEQGYAMLRRISLTLLALVMCVAPALAATKVTVNGVPISDIQISQRVKLMQLEGGGSTAKATQQLIDDQLKLQEAKRLGIEITESQVDDAYVSVARNVKLSTDKLRQVLSQAGVSVDTMRSRLKAALAWQKVGEVAIAARVDVSEAKLDEEAASKLKQDQSYDYILKEVLFVVNGETPARRTAEANQYRKAFKGCDSAVDVALSFTDAAVRDIGRRHATQLPDAIADELSKLQVGGITKPRVTETGVSMLAICEKESARDLTFLKNKLRNEQGSQAMKDETEKYLADLRAKAKIVYL